MNKNKFITKHCLHLLNSDFKGESDLRADLLTTSSKCYRINDKTTAQSIEKESNS